MKSKCAANVLPWCHVNVLYHNLSGVCNRRARAFANDCVSFQTILDRIVNRDRRSTIVAMWVFPDPASRPPTQ